MLHARTEVHPRLAAVHADGDAEVDGPLGNLQPFQHTLGEIDFIYDDNELIEGLTIKRRILEH